ncbi:MAG: nicotinate-nicotinamide nucleotide adenylyltransferase [Spirochaetia bacterium]|nr:nicotinate-nicotinamide nucleotide adenylyltransferase [Spirochaetia bacterium]
MHAPEKYAIFGGSFNPVQKAHVEIVKEIIKKFNIEKIFIVPAYEPPHKADVSLLSFRYRFKLLRAAFLELIKSGKVKLSIIEKKLPAPSYTVNTMKKFLTCFPETEFSLIIGYDMYMTFDKWRDSEFLAENFHFIVAEREEQKKPGASLEFKKGVSSLDHKHADVSSTGARELLAEYYKAVDKKSGVKADEILSELKKIIPEEALYYILEKKLYFNYGHREH